MQRRPSGREQETQRVSPPVRNGAPQIGRSGNNGRPAPDPAGAKRPPGAGRALAGGFGPRLVLIPAQHCGRGDGPCHWCGSGPHTAPPRAGPGNARRFPRPCGTVPRRPAGPGPAEGQRPTRRERSARHGRVGRWPGALAHGGRAGRTAQSQSGGPARPRGTRAGGKVFCFPLSRPICSAPLQWPVRIGSFWVRDAKNCLEFKAAISKVRTSADGPLVLRFIRADG